MKIHSYRKNQIKKLARISKVENDLYTQVYNYLYNMDLQTDEVEKALDNLLNGEITAEQFITILENTR